MLLLRGDKGREAAKDSPGTEEVRDPPSSLKGTRLDFLLLAVVELVVEYFRRSSENFPRHLPFRGNRLFGSSESVLVFHVFGIRILQ